MTRWLTPDERAAWIGLSAVLERLPAALDAQLRRDAGLTHFEYWVLAMLSEADGHSLPLNALGDLTRASLPRLSHVVRRLEERELLRRSPNPHDARVTDATLTDAGWRLIVRAAPGHVDAVRASVFDALTPEQVDQLERISFALLAKIAPDAVPAAQRIAGREPVAGPKQVDGHGDATRKATRGVR